MEAEAAMEATLAEPSAVDTAAAEEITEVTEV